METDEEYVRARWEVGSKVPCGPNIMIVLDDPYWIGPRRGEVDDLHWAAAKAFTVEREQEIAFLEGEISLVEEARLAQEGVDYAQWTRILKRLQQALAELTKGMKPQP
jgi:hypothetical protein